MCGTSKPLAIDLYCGLGGWTEGLLAEGYRVVGFDNERHAYGDQAYPAQLVLQDVLTIHGRQLKDAALIVASPPCQEYSYMAMPWSIAKQKARDYESGKLDVKQLTALFDACFRIQCEASEAKGEHIPLVVENVRGAQKWVGRSRWNFGSFHLWGDVPALMPMTLKAIGRRTAVGTGARFCSREDGRKATRGGKDGWFGDYQAMKDGIKQHGSGREWFAGDGRISRLTSSKSPARKAASAMIAKIPLVLSRHIAKSWHPANA